MTIISLTDCCQLLAIDPKTLRNWMRLSHLEALAHPLDARRKCLTREQLQQLAAAHHRTLETPGGPHLRRETSALPTATHGASATVLSDVRPNLGVAPLSMIIHILRLLLKGLMGLRPIRKRAISPDFSAPITDLIKQLTSLQAHVAALQDQLALLNCQLQKEHQWRASVASTTETKSVESFPGSSQNLSQEKSQDPSQESSQDLSQKKSVEPSWEKSVESSPGSSRDLSQENPQESSRDLSQEKSVEPSRKKKQAHTTANVPSIDEHRHSHVLPWVEYGAQGKYVVISPEQGLLEFEPDSPEWFAREIDSFFFSFYGQARSFYSSPRGINIS